MGEQSLESLTRPEMRERHVWNVVLALMLPLWYVRKVTQSSVEFQQRITIRYLTENDAVEKVQPRKRDLKRLSLG
jgi:hypothetical protein